MSFLSEASSRGHFQPRNAKDHELIDLDSPPAYDDDSDYLADTSSRASLGLEPLDFDDADFSENHGMLRHRLLNSARSWIRPARNVTLWDRNHHYSMAWLTGSFGRRPRFSRLLYFLVVYFLVFLGLIHLSGIILHVLEETYSDDMDWILQHWGQESEESEGWDRWPTDATGDIHPVNCHSHNDYWRPVPLYSAIHAGCTGAEADVWLIDDELFVGHTRYALTANRTLKNLYVDPLLDLIEKQNPPVTYHTPDDYPPDEDLKQLNGVFDVEPSQTFVLLIDFKTDGSPLWWKLLDQLAPLREKGYLTHFDGSGVVEKPVTIVVTGNAPFNLLTANETYRDVFFDAPLEDMADRSSQWPNPNRAQDPSRGHQRSLIPRSDLGQGHTGTPLDSSVYDATNSYYASTSFTSSIGRVWGSRLTQNQLQLIRGQTRGAHQRGLKVRYWSLPTWPIGLRNHVWHILIREGVDMLNVDDLRHATRRDWRKRKGWRF